MDATTIDVPAGNPPSHLAGDSRTETQGGPRIRGRARFVLYRRTGGDRRSEAYRAAKNARTYLVPDEFDTEPIETGNFVADCLAYGVRAAAEMHPEDSGTETQGSAGRTRRRRSGSGAGTRTVSSPRARVRNGSRS